MNREEIKFDIGTLPESVREFAKNAKLYVCRSIKI
jgi:hypothetical protein